MTPSDGPSPWSTHIAARAAAVGFDLTDVATQRLATFRRLVQARAPREGLMSARAAAAIDDHLIDALAAASRLPAWAHLCLDVGAGAGIPGVPVAIARPDIEMTLLDARRGRVAFLDDVAAALPDLRLRTVRARAEVDAHGPRREAFDVVLARALAPMPTLAELTLAYVRPGGRLLALKTAAAREEIEAARPAIEAQGGRLLARHEFSWAGLRLPRVIVEVEKVAPTPSQYPRADGLPRKRPLRATPRNPRRR